MTIGALAKEVGGHNRKFMNELSEEHRKAVDLLLKRGIGPKAVAHYLQGECGLFADTKPEALRRSISRYKTDHIDGEMVLGLAKAGALKTVQKLQNIDIMEAAAAGLNAARTRLDKAVELQKDKPLLLEQGRREIETYMRVVDTVRGIQLATGAIQPAPKKLTASVRPNGEGGFDVNAQIGALVPLAEEVLKEFGFDDDAGQSSTDDTAV